MLTERAYRIRGRAIHDRAAEGRAAHAGPQCRRHDRQAERPKIVVGAHYDAARLADGTLSKGAVDNAASAVILVRLAETLSKARRHDADSDRVFRYGRAGPPRLGTVRPGPPRAADARDGESRCQCVWRYADLRAARPAANDSRVSGIARGHASRSQPTCVEFPRMPPSDDMSFQKGRDTGRIDCHSPRGAGASIVAADERRAKSLACRQDLLRRF